MHGVFLDTGSFHPADLDWQALRESVDTCDLYEHTPADRVAERIAAADVVFSNKAVIGEAEFAAAKNVKLVVVLATGTNNIDLAAATAAGVCVCNNVGYSTPSLVEHTVALIMSLAKQLPAYRDALRDKRWQQQRQFCLLEPAITQLHGKTLGIIGYGASGSGVARVCSAMGMNVIALGSENNDQNSPARREFDTFLAESDVVSVHCPLTERSHNMIDLAAMRKMKSSAILVNTARGGIVNEADLVTALEENLIWAAGVDVLTEEPPKDDNPLVTSQHPRLLVTPHNAWGSRESRQALVDQSAKIVREFRVGNVMNRVNPQ